MDLTVTSRFSDGSLSAATVTENPYGTWQGMVSNVNNGVRTETRRLFGSGSVPEQYWIQIRQLSDDPSNDGMEYSLSVQTLPYAGHTPYPYTCSQPGIAFGEGTYRGSTAALADNHDGRCATDTGNEAVWRYTTDTARGVTIDTAGSSFDTVVYVRSSCSGYEWSCNDDYYGSRQGQLYFSAQPGVDYYIFVDGWGTESGDYVFELTEW